MSLQKVTFNNAHVQAADHGALFSGIIKDGIISGCDITVSDGTISISPGYFVAAGRLIHNNNTITNSGFTNNIIQIILEVSVVNDTDTLDSMLKWYQVTDVATANEHVFTKQDINVGGANTRYDLEIAVIDVSQSIIVRKMPVCVSANPLNILDEVPTNWSGYPNGIYIIKDTSNS